MYTLNYIQDCHGKSIIQQGEYSYHQLTGLIFREEITQWDLDNSEIRSEIPGKFRNVVLEKDVEDKLNRSCEK